MRAGESYLINSTKLEIDLEILLIQRLQQRVQQPTQKRTRNLLHDLRPRFPRIVFGSDRTEFVLVHVVFVRVLVRRSDDESEEMEWKSEGTEDGGEEESVVVYSTSDEFDGGFEIVQEGVDVYSMIGIEFRFREDGEEELTDRRGGP